MEEIKQKIKNFYKSYDIEIDIIKYIDSLSVTSFYGKFDATIITINKIEKLVDNLALYLCIENVKTSIDFESGCIIFEIPKKERKMLLYDELQKDNQKQTNGLFVNIGMTTQNNIYNINLCKMPHLLIAGTTGSGKSMLVNTILTSLLQSYSPYELQLLLIDPKQVEFSSYANIPHLLTKTITNLADTKTYFVKIINEIEARYNVLKNNNSKNIESYNKKTNNKMPYILIVVDELADLLIQDNKSKLKSDITGEKRIEDLICRVAQVGRACGVHLILATQRPSSDVITGLIKANIPSRIALTTATATDSRIILDCKGAEKLQGNGDMLLKSIDNKKLIRLQGAYISEEQQEKIINDIIQKNQGYIKEKQQEIEKQQKIQELVKSLEQKRIIEENERQTYIKEQQEKKEKRKKVYNFIFNIIQYTFSPIGLIILFIIFNIWFYFYITG